VLGDLGFNLNQAVSDFLHPFYNTVEIAYCPYIGKENDHGEKTAVYGPPIVCKADVQVPSSAELIQQNKVNDSEILRQFWINAEILPVSRIDNRGGDKIYHDGFVWYVVSHPDDFRQVGWMSVIAVKTLERVPEPEEPTP
jgi:hypothetical protein